MEPTKESFRPLTGIVIFNKKSKVLRSILVHYGRFRPLTGIMIFKIVCR